MTVIECQRAIAAAQERTKRLEKVLVSAGTVVAVVVHGTTWEIAPDVKDHARAVEAEILSALQDAKTDRATEGGA